jgi:hypothetical protein
MGREKNISIHCRSLKVVTLKESTPLVIMYSG